MTVQDQLRGPAKAERIAVQPTSTQDAAASILDMVRGLRRLTDHRKDLQFLEYLLAMAEEEAQQLASRPYH